MYERHRSTLPLADSVFLAGAAYAFRPSAGSTALLFGGTYHQHETENGTQNSTITITTPGAKS
ncbi:hypothetical protein PPN31114_04530 [Pandoraea pneumonica]|uniref:Uncharacterized protein n=1 Tax=Pandoraea pneumonica TaxID=2508299 RepID=A0A5E4YGL4_9BURK|nr:hypothetical protein PPN31114_04530 [Pandoraea pneumonica]